jgi:hypothetical protein
MQAQLQIFATGSEFFVHLWAVSYPVDGNTLEEQF